jgi:hypothetical protein
MALPAANHSFKKEKKHRDQKLDQRLTEAPIKSNQTSEISWLKKWKEKKKSLNTFEDELKKIKNVFTIDYSIGKTRRKLQLDAEPDAKNRCKNFKMNLGMNASRGSKKGRG